MNNTRIEQTFAHLRRSGHAGLVTFVTAGDPDYETSLALVRALPKAGANIIELGMPFSDPMADGPVIQASSLRALHGGMNLRKVLKLVQEFRSGDTNTPIILMGYYNPIYSYGTRDFVKDARTAGVDGLIVVDLPPEEDAELCLPAIEAGLNFIRLATPTTDAKRLPRVLENTTGFLYYVSISGITGTKSGQETNLEAALKRIRQYCHLPIAVGFGVRTPDQAAKIASFADAVVVGSALVEKMAQNGKDAVPSVTALVGTFAAALKKVRRSS